MVLYTQKGKIKLLTNYTYLDTYYQTHSETTKDGTSKCQMKHKNSLVNTILECTCYDSVDKISPGYSEITDREKAMS